MSLELACPAFSIPTIPTTPEHSHSAHSTTKPTAPHVVSYPYFSADRPWFPNRQSYFLLSTSSAD
eukprot:scaffold1954_cov268-Pinguiococcus_pyrenoidosus.AAC.320